jgi:hypothetical protein
MKQASRGDQEAIVVKLNGNNVELRLYVQS